MILSRNCASSLLIGVVIATAAATGQPACADGALDGPVVLVADNCAIAYGPGFIDMGDGTCGRVHIRIEAETPHANGWPGGTSSAALRSNSMGMIPGIVDPGHLRVRKGLQTYSPFQ